MISDQFEILEVEVPFTLSKAFGPPEASPDLISEKSTESWVQVVELRSLGYEKLDLKPLDDPGCSTAKTCLFSLLGLAIVKLKFPVKLVYALSETRN